MTFKNKITLAFILVTVSLSTALAQTKFNISGKVTDEQHLPLPNISIVLQKGKAAASSNEQGNYILKEIAPGTYTVTFSAIGFNSRSLNVTVDTKNVQLDVRLTEAKNNLNNVDIRGLNKEAAEVKKIINNVMPVTVITAKQIENRAGNLNEILARQAGIQIRQSGGLGSEARISVRGLEGKRVQVFIDGNPLNTPDGSLGINDLPLQIIERIEIYKGAVPAWLGGDGLGSAVNVVIKHRDVSYIDATASYQSYNTKNLGLILKKTFDQSGIEVGAGIFDVRSDNNYKMESPYQPGLTVTRDHDKYHSLLVGGSVKFHKLWFDELELESAYIGTDKEVQGIQRNIQHAESKGKSAVVALNFVKTGLLDNKLSFRNNFILGRFNIRFTDTSSYSYNWDGTRTPSIYGKGELGIGPNQSTTIQNEIRDRFNINYLLNKKLTLNLNNAFRYGTLHPTDDLGNQYAGKNLYNYPGTLHSSVTGLTLESRFLNDKFLLSAGIKHFYSLINGYNTNIYVNDQPDEVNNRTSKLGYTLGARYNFTDDLLIKASHEKGIRFPANAELFGDGALITPAIFLKPEESFNNNIGLVYDHTSTNDRRLQVEINGFYMKVDQLIQLAGNGLSLGYVNYAKAKIIGADADIKSDITDHLYASINLTWQRLTDNNRYIPGTQNIANPTYGLTIPNTPNLFSNWNVEYHHPDWLGKNSKTRFMYDGSYVKQFNYGFDLSIYDEYKIPSYYLHTLSVEQSFCNSRYTFTAECNNLMDTRVINNYNQPLAGRTFRVKFRYLLLSK